jgi:queuine tRNA-ribosyltransferase
MSFELIHQDKESKARAGILKTAHGDIKTPIFMPVGTQATVKGIHNYELDHTIKAQIILGNTYHLYLRPGMEIITKAGGLHKFMNWQKPILTDSGGYQVYSLKGMRKITEEGVKFQSHIDGSKHLFSPEKVMDIQRQIGADIIMAFDECTPYPCEYNYAKKSINMTHRWLGRCIDRFKETEELYGFKQFLAPIVQGSTYKDLRIESAKYIADQNLEINAIGGLSVGEPHEDLYAMTDIVTDHLPIEKPRYLMGVGLPENILECVTLGIDMFDCVLPSRNARHGILYTWNGILNMKNAKWKEDFSPIDINSSTASSRNHSKAYLRHLFHVKELLAGQIATLHNLAFFIDLVTVAREHIIAGDFYQWKNKVVLQLQARL